MSELGRQRHRSRERALELAYEASSKSRSLVAVVAEQPIAPDPYSVAILTSVERHRSEIDQLIEDAALEWTLDRLAVIDRLVMTLALGELMMDGAPPCAVVLDEAVELAKTFSTESSGSFVNGVLNTCVGHLK